MPTINVLIKLKFIILTIKNTRIFLFYSTQNFFEYSGIKCNLNKMKKHWFLYFFRVFKFKFQFSIFNTHGFFNM